MDQWMIPMLSMAGLGIAWIGKSILKPWSDAYLIEKQANAKAVADKTKAETDHIRNLDVALTSMMSESKKQSESLESIDKTLKTHSAALETVGKQITEMNADNKKLCRVEELFKANVLKTCSLENKDCPFHKDQP